MPISEKVMSGAVARYDRERDRYLKLAARVSDICRTSIVEDNAIRAQVTFRTKTVQSFEGKLKRFSRRQDKNYATVDDVFAGVGDFAGVRIATYRPKDEQRVTEEICRLFEGESGGDVFVDKKDKLEKDKALEQLGAATDWLVSTAVVVEGIMKLFSSNPKRDTQLMLTPSRNTRRVLLDGPRDRSPLRAPYIETNDNLIYTLVFNYLAACEDVFWSKASNKSFIMRTVGVQALFDVLRRVFAPAVLEKLNSPEFRRHPPG